MMAYARQKNNDQKKLFEEFNQAPLLVPNSPTDVNTGLAQCGFFVFMWNLFF